MNKKVDNQVGVVQLLKDFSLAKELEIDPRTVAGRAIFKYLGKYADLYFPLDKLDELKDMSELPTLDCLESIEDEDFASLLGALGASRERNSGCGSHGLEIYCDLIYAICNTIENFYVEVQYREARMKSWVPKPSNAKELATS